jgi:hypothetical protein
VAKAAFRKKALCTSNLDFNFSRKQLDYYEYILSIAVYGAAGWALRKMGQKYLEGFKMWGCRRTEEVSWTDRVRDEEVFRRVRELRNIRYKRKLQKAN